MYICRRNHRISHYKSPLKICFLLVLWIFPHKKRWHANVEILVFSLLISVAFLWQVHVLFLKIAKKITKSNGNSQLHGTAFSGQPLVDTYIMYLLDGVEEDNYNWPLWNKPLYKSIFVWPYLFAFFLIQWYNVVSFTSETNMQIIF